MASFNNNNVGGQFDSASFTNNIPLKINDTNDVVFSPKSYNSIGSRRDSKALSRTESGQTVERKRRDNINDKIQELGTIIPSKFFESNKDKSSGTKDGKPNKGQVLSKSIEYIEFLQDKIDENNKKEIELLIILKKLEELKKVPDHLKPSKTLFRHTSAEVALQNIGVGPLAESNPASTGKNTPSVSNSRMNSPGVVVVNGNNGMNRKNNGTINEENINHRNNDHNNNNNNNNIPGTSNNERLSIGSVGSPLVQINSTNDSNSNMPSPGPNNMDPNVMSFSNADNMGFDGILKSENFDNFGFNFDQ
ncbi:Rtg1 protein [Saccharomycopsis crataegensis]|uniref:Rtg1 protein n=1 Tax=Saccharomycopsis crataegensis TaxID=43959 RepID=A0AAV5QV83_9ASCO|nr:Rtg1 protein [Saccharomycopsis crataegensis]